MPTPSKGKKNMTEKAIAANRENGKKGNGPVTPEGKSVSALNALSHGFRGSRTVLPHENMGEFLALSQSLISLYAPMGVFEGFLVSQIAARMWECERAQLMKQEALMRSEFRDELLKELHTLEGHHSRIERALFRLRKELDQEQKRRGKENIPSESAWMQTTVYHGPMVPQLPTQAEAGLDGASEMAVRRVASERRLNRRPQQQMDKYVDNQLSHLSEADWDALSNPQAEDDDTGLQDDSPQTGTS